MQIKDHILLILRKIYNALNRYYIEKKGFYDHIIGVNKTKGILCPEPRWVGELVLKLVFFLLMFSLLWLLYIYKCFYLS